MRSVMNIFLAVGLLGGAIAVARAGSGTDGGAHGQASAATSKHPGSDGQEARAVERLKGVHLPVQMKHGRLVVVPAQKAGSNGKSPQSPDG